MLVRVAVVAVAADPKSCESFYLTKITEEEKGDGRCGGWFRSRY